MPLSSSGYFPGAATAPAQAGCQNDGTAYTQPGCSVIGTPGSTWTRITVPWGAISGSTDISGQGPNLYFGAGYIGGGWPAEPHYQQTAARSYFTGDIAAIIYSYPGGP
jgi:hypothetical protein